MCTNVARYRLLVKGADRVERQAGENLCTAMHIAGVRAQQAPTFMPSLLSGDRSHGMMTIKVYRVLPDGTREPVSHEQVTAPLDIPASQGFPPCSCPRCKAGSWCSFHLGPSSTAAPVDEHRSACAPCREQRGLRVVRWASS